MSVSTAVRVRVEPNVTPMIDVMLVLLIIFMVVAPMLETGFRATPPSGTNLTDHPDEAGEAVIGIDQHGQLYLNRQPVTRDQLRARLAEWFGARGESRVVYLHADQDAEFQAVQETLAVAEQAGARVVGLVATASHEPFDQTP
jgi:biopolymer transport protein ExbD